MIEKGIIEIIPLYMRGRTLDNAIIILDEGQNTQNQMLMAFPAGLFKMIVTATLPKSICRKRRCRVWSKP